MRAAAAPTVADQAWHREAACRPGTGVDPELFFGRDPEGPNEARARVRAAKRVCAGCPVRELCAADALDRREAFGVWGGLSEGDRRQVTGDGRRGGKGRAA